VHDPNTVMAPFGLGWIFHGLNASSASKYGVNSDRWKVKQQNLGTLATLYFNPTAVQH
jgi:hypothetical protein